MASISDERGYNQGFQLVRSTEVRMRRRAEAFIAAMNLDGPQKIQEIGCGTGEISFWIAEHTDKDVLGADLSAKFIAFAQTHYQRSNLRYEQLDFTREEQMPSVKYDYVVGNGILHHLYSSLDVALKRMKGLLKTGGKILFYEPNIYNPYCALIFNIPFLRAMAHLEPTEMAFSRRFIKEKLTDAGFTDIVVDYKDFLVPGIPDVLVQPSIVFGSIAERIPLIKALAQSLFIKAHA